jgi:hypothetical protein
MIENLCQVNLGLQPIERIPEREDAELHCVLVEPLLDLEVATDVDRRGRDQPVFELSIGLGGYQHASSLEFRLGRPIYVAGPFSRPK